MNLKFIFEVIDMDREGAVVVPKSQSFIRCNDEDMRADANIRDVPVKENIARVVTAQMLVVARAVTDVAADVEVVG